MTSMVSQALWIYFYITLIGLIAVSVYGIVVRPNLLKKIIALSILGDTANTFIIFLGFRRGGAAVPIFPSIKPTLEELLWFKETAVDPLPQCLVITAIVINMSVTAFLIALAIQLYRLYGTLDVRKAVRLRG